MTTVARPTGGKSIWRWLSPRFSLRLLLIAVTAFAIGFPIWYRWPYEEEVVSGPSQDPFAAYKDFRSYTTWQRQWGGGRLRHGTQRTVRDGTTSTISTYRNDELNGPYQNFYIGSGILAEGGQYLDGEKDGVWTTYNDDSSLRSTTSWRKGQLDGPATIGGIRGKQQHRLVFAAGQIVEVDGKPLNDPLGALLAAGKIDSPNVVEVLGWPMGGEYINLPLPMIVDNLTQNRRGPIVVDRWHVASGIPVNCNGVDIPFAACLAVMAAENGLACDYRYGCIWITSAEDAKEWSDPTGLAEVRLPQDSPLSQSWTQHITIRAASQPLDQSVRSIAGPLAIEVDTSSVAPAGEGDPEYAVTCTLSDLPFRDALGVLLYQTGCRCRLEGETLVILPPEELP